MAGETQNADAGRNKVALHMSKGDREDSYSRNSNVQKRLIEKVVIPNLDDVLAHFHLSADTKCIVLADLGCSSGPNALCLVSQAVHRIQENMASKNQPLWEFQAFFNDLPSNDFNSLFKLLSSRDFKRPDVFSAGAPGSFFEPLFPESTVHIFVSAFAAHYLSKIPASVLDRESPAFNKGTWFAMGRGSNRLAENAFKEQFAEDLDRFLKLRAKELVPGGLLCFAICSRWSFESGVVMTSMDTAFKCSENAFKTLVEKGIISEDKVDFFNIPIYFPDTSWLKSQILKHCFTFEVLALKEVRVQPFVMECGGSQAGAQQEAVQSSTSMIRGSLGDMARHQLGEEAASLLFEQYGEEAMANAEELSRDTAIAFIALKKKLAT